MQTDQNHPAEDTPKTALTDKQRYWLAKIQAASVSGQSLSAYARAHELNPQQLYQYQHVLRQKGVLKAPDIKPGFSKVRIDEKSSLSFSQARMARLHFPNGLRLDFPVDIDSASLCALLNQLWPRHAASR